MQDWKEPCSATSPCRGSQGTRPESKQDMAGANTNTAPPSLCHPAQAIRALQHCTFLPTAESYTEKSAAASLNTPLMVAERFYF